MTPTTRNRLLAISALAVAAVALGAVAFGNIGDNLVYYWSPQDLLSHGEKAYGPTIRLGGLVAPKSIEWNSAATELKFKVGVNKEGTGPLIPVVAKEIPPQMFREGIGVVVEGTYARNGIFTSNRLMVNHSNEYRAPQTVDGGLDPHHWQTSVAEEKQ